MSNFGNDPLGFFSLSSGGGGGGSVTSVGATAPLVATPNPITSTGTLSIPVATASANGYLSSANWTTFNSKLSGSGTAGVIPKFTGSGATIGNGLLIDNTTYVQVGSFTLGTNVASSGSVNFATTGIIGASNGIFLNDVTGLYTKQGVYRGSNRIEFFAGGGELVRMNLATNGYLQITRGFNNTAGSQLAITGGISVDANNSSNYTFVNVTPTINQSNPPFTGSGQIRGFYYNPNIASLGGTTIHYAWENTTGGIRFGNLTGSNTEVVMIDSNGVLVKQNAQSQFNLYDGSTAKGLLINYTTESYILGNTASLKSSFRIGATALATFYGSDSIGLSIDFPTERYVIGNSAPNKAYFGCGATDLTSYFNNVADGLNFDFTNDLYQFGYLNNVANDNIYLKVDGSLKKISCVFNENENGLGLNFDTRVFEFGDFAGIVSGNKISVDSNNNSIDILCPSNAGTITLATDVDSGIIELKTQNLKLDLPTTGSATQINEFLKVFINGTEYRIEIFDP